MERIKHIKLFIGAKASKIQTLDSRFRRKQVSAMGRKERQKIITPLSSYSAPIWTLHNSLLSLQHYMTLEIKSWHLSSNFGKIKLAGAGGTWVNPHRQAAVVDAVTSEIKYPHLAPSDQEKHQKISINVVCIHWMHFNRLLLGPVFKLTS